jgi:glyoxylate reductase
MAKPSVLLTCRIPSSAMARLEAVCEVDRHGADVPFPHEELLRRVAGKQALLSLLTDRVDRDVIAAGADLRIIANIAVGYDNVDVTYAATRGIPVTNTPDVLTEATAEFTWALILAVARRVVEGERVLRGGRWRGWGLDFMLGMELRGKCLGVVGMGRIGTAVAARAPAFGMNVVHHSEETRGGHAVSLDELLCTADVVTLHVPLTPATRHMIDRAALVRMKRSAYLINTARGPIVDEAALAWALGERLIAGAALDVYEREPEVHPALLSLDNVVLAPHLGSATTETRTAMADLAVSNVLAVIEGRPPLTPVPGPR